jgi:hypothetical protein
VKLFLQLIRMLFSVGWVFVWAVAEVSCFAQIRFATVVSNYPITAWPRGSIGDRETHCAPASVHWRDAMTRTPDIYLTPTELDKRSAQLSDDATHMRIGRARDTALKAATQDRNMAELMRYAGYSEHEGPSSKRVL